MFCSVLLSFATGTRLYAGKHAIYHFKGYHSRDIAWYVEKHHEALCLYHCALGLQWSLHCSQRLKAATWSYFFIKCKR